MKLKKKNLKICYLQTHHSHQIIVDFFKMKLDGKKKKKIKKSKNQKIKQYLILSNNFDLKKNLILPNSH